MEARGQKGNILKFSQVDGPNGVRLHMPYTYKVREVPYVGRYTEEFESLELAELARLTLTERTVYARYNPANPSDSLLDPYRDTAPVGSNFSPGAILKILPRRMK